MTTGEPIVRFSGVQKSYGRTPAVHDLDLDLARGQFTTLLGPSGCGKSTILRMLGGFERPSAGRILIEGQDVTPLPPERRDVNMVFQDYALFPHMTVAQNIAFGLELKGWARPAILRRVDQLLALVRLEGTARRMTDQLSGGQRQRVALARALAPEPKVLLLDEPLGALDAKLRQQMQVELKSIQETTGKTFLFVTHDQEEALAMSDRVVVMNAGRVEQEGTPLELYERPRSRFVANFVGETNFLPGTVRSREGDWLVLAWGGRTLRAAADIPVSAGMAVEAVLRPEHASCTAVEPATLNRLPGTIRARRFAGHRTVLSVEVADAGMLQVATEPSAARELGCGPVWVGFEPARLSVLPPASAGAA